MLAKPGQHSALTRQAGGVRPAVIDAATRSRHSLSSELVLPRPDAAVRCTLPAVWVSLRDEDVRGASDDASNRGNGNSDVLVK